MSDIDMQARSAGPSTKSLDSAQWGLVLAGTAAAIFLPLIGQGVFIALLLTIPFALIHGTRRYGWRLFLSFFVVTFIVSNAFENLSILTGFPFGNYHYSGSLKLFHVPIFIGPIYFGLGYVSWLVASTIVDRADEHLDLRERGGRINVVILPVLAAAAMTMFDVGSDSAASTVGHAWIWEKGGGVFGVPYTNYLGWWFVTYVFFQIFALMLARLQSRDSRAEIARPGNMLQPVIIYLSLGLSSVSQFIMKAADTSSVSDQAGTAWGVAALAETMMTINIFGLVVIAFIAVARLVHEDVRLASRQTA